MTTLLIKTKDNKVYRAKLPMHFMVAEKHGIEPKDIKKTGFITHGREVWVSIKPH